MEQNENDDGRTNISSQHASPRMSIEKGETNSKGKDLEASNHLITSNPSIGTLEPLQNHEVNALCGIQNTALNPR